jgi:hypothetical protein
MATNDVFSDSDKVTGHPPTLWSAATTRLACDECWPRQARATWSWSGTDALGRRWRAVVCQNHLSLLDEEIAERGGSGALEPIDLHTWTG